MANITHNRVLKSASQVALSWMQLAFHATRPKIALGGSNVCVVGENPTCSVPVLLSLIHI